MQRTSGRLLVGAATALVTICGMQAPALAATVKACVKNSNGSIRIVASPAACGGSETFLEWTKNGPYGDGSAGSLTVTGFASLEQDAQFTDLTIEEGANFFVSPGTVIRCTGTFTNHGRIFVSMTPNWGDVRSFNAGALYPSFMSPLPGMSRGLPYVGELGDATSDREGGFGGKGHQADLTRNDPLIPVTGGGGGAGRVSTGPFSSGNGGDGGGHLAILAQGGIVNTGVIEANGNQIVTGGGGGGGGGVVLLASAQSITHSGTIEATGGAGGIYNASGAPGGGGGGGFVRLVSPIITNTGTIDVSGGPAGLPAAPGTISEPFRQGGAGGGACFGDGGRGGDALTNGASTVAFPGDEGLVIETLADPTSLL